MRLRKVLFGFVLFSGAAALAQDTTTIGTPVKDLNFTVDGRGEVTVNVGDKIEEEPFFSDTVKVDTEVDYNFVDKKLNSGYQVETIKAPKLKMLEPLQKLYKGYAAIGVNDFKTPPYFDFNYSTIRNRQYNLGMAIDHISQQQDIGDINQARYTNTGASFFGKKFLENKTWYSSADYELNTFRYYGYNTDDYIGTPDEGLLSSGYSVLKVNTGLMSNRKKAGKLSYDVNVGYNQLFAEAMVIAEHQVDLGAKVGFVWKNKVIDGIVDIDFGTSYLNSGRNFKDHSSVLFNLKPTFNIKKNKLDATVGGEVFFMADEDRGIYAYPFVEADYSFVKDVLHVFGRLTGGFKRNSYLQYQAINPFLTNSEDVTNTNKRIDFMGGLKGAFNSKSSFNLGLRFKRFKEMPIFYNVGNSGLNQFRVLTDKVDQRQVFGEFVWDGKQLDISAKGEYNIYDVFTHEAYNMPNIYAELGASYNLQDKIKVGADVFFYGQQLALDYFDAEDRPVTKKLDPIVDFNVKMEYNYNKRLGAFLRVNNILNTKHIRWDQYANYGLNFLFGVGYSF